MTPLYPESHGRKGKMRKENPSTSNFHIYAQVPEKNNIGRQLLLERIEENDCVVECLNKIVYIFFSVVEVETGTCTCTGS